jgi:general secretion pathway protein G
MGHHKANKQTNKQTGFTIVELLIVIVVIGILAAITLVAYNGLQDRANDSARTSAVS